MGLGSGIRKNLFRIPDPGVKKAPDLGSRIRIRNTGLKDESSPIFTWKKRTKTTHWYQAWRISSPSSVTLTSHGSGLLLG